MYEKKGVVQGVASLRGPTLCTRSELSTGSQPDRSSAVSVGWLLLLLLWRRRGVPDRIVLGRYLIGGGMLGFVIEFIRVNKRVAFGLSVAHLVSLAAIAVGDDGLGALDGCCRCGLDHHGVQQLHHVVPLESETSMGNRRVASRRCQLRCVRHRAALAHLKPADASRRHLDTIRLRLR
jgi:hypothetical protein